MREKYLLKVSIDFGSTNTVMAWRVYEADENGRLTSGTTVTASSVSASSRKRIMIF